MTAATLLDFRMLDHLARAVDQGSFQRAALPSVRAQTLGPVIEALSLTPAWRGSPLADMAWLETGQFDSMIRDVEAARTSQQMSGARLGWICSDCMFEGEHWTDFLIRISAAMNAHSFDTRIRNGVSAMLGEFRSNIAEHSGRKDSAVAAFLVNEDGIEIAISDRGRGVLESLRENPQYASLADAGIALRLSVSDGISRHPDPGRGHGFTHLFRGLANRFSMIRMRSGDHALEVIRGDIGEPKERLSQKVFVQGLQIYSRFDREVAGR